MTTWDSWDQAQEVAGNDSQGALKGRIRDGLRARIRDQNRRAGVKLNRNEVKGPRRLDPVARAANLVQLNTGRTKVRVSLLTEYWQ